MSNEIRERYDEARAAWSEWRTRALEDLRFSNPARPEQWPDDVIRARGRNRPALVFDQTNQYIQQVVNDARQNRPAIEVLPSDNKASDEAADFYGGLIRQIEYASRAQIAYDTAIEHAARIGLGYILVVPELVDPRYNDHDIRIKAIHDPLAVTFDPDSKEPDGQDADCAWLETMLSEGEFKRRWPKAKMAPFKGDSWFDGKSVRVCQYFERSYVKSNRIITTDGQDFAEDEYHDQMKKLGFALPVHNTYLSNEPQTMWQWLSGEEVLEETAYPAPYVGIVPVYGNVLWIEGKRYVCGMTRRMMDGQRAYNYERSAYVEAVALTPKAPWTAAARAIARYQQLWDNANTENRSVLPFDHVDDNGNTIPPPQRQQPPMPGSAFVENAQLALSDIQASVGMYKASLGQNSNAKSGVAINKLQTEGDTATYHYIDNLSRSIEQVGRISVALIPSYYDRQKVAQILGVDGKASAVMVNPELPAAHMPAQQQGDVMQVNPAVGAYSVRVKTGPSYTSQREAMQDRLTQMGQGNPQLAAAMAPLLLQQSDMPGADKAAQVAIALLPPPVQQIYNEDNGPQVPPQFQMQMQQAQQHIQQLTQMLQQAGGELQKLKAGDNQKFNELLIKAYDAETARIAALGKTMSPEAVIQLVQQVVAQALGTPSPADIVPPDGQGSPQGGLPPPGTPGAFPAPPNPNQPPPGGFFMPDSGPAQITPTAGDLAGLPLGAQGSLGQTS